jgi:hypothetical protein
MNRGNERKVFHEIANLLQMPLFIPLEKRHKGIVWMEKVYLSKLQNKVVSDRGITTKSVIRVLPFVANITTFTIFRSTLSMDCYHLFRAFSKHHGAIAIFLHFC